MKRRLITLAVSAVLSGALLCFTSCVNEAPEINYQVEYHHTTDFSELIKVINDQTLSLASKIAAVEDAVAKGTASLSEASSALKDAITKALDDQTSSINEKLETLTQAVNSQALTLEDKLSLIEKAIKDGTTTLSKVIGNIAGSLENKLDIIAKAINDGAATINDAMEAMGGTLVDAVEQGVIDLGDAVEALGDIVEDALGGDGSIAAKLTAIEGQLELVAGALENTDSNVEDIIEALGIISDAIDDQSDAIAEALAEDGALAGKIDDIIDIIEELKDAIPDSADIIAALKDIEHALNPDEHEGVQLWAGGPYWATTNIGATKPDEYGLYFTWANDTGYAQVNSTFPIFFNKENYAKTAGAKLSGDIPANSTYDAARANWGKNWRMPTEDEFEDLIAKCDSKWCDGITEKYKGSNVRGYWFTGKGDYSGYSIFFPAAGLGFDDYLLYAGSLDLYYGYYWSSTFFGTSTASCLYFGYKGTEVLWNGFSDGLPVRPVHD